MTMMVFGNAPIWEMHENPWDPIPGELPIRVHPDYDLGVPYTFFEYEMDSRMHHMMTDDQMYIPEDARPFPSEKNPHCSSELWRPQEDLKEEDQSVIQTGTQRILNSISIIRNPSKGNLPVRFIESISDCEINPYPHKFI